MVKRENFQQNINDVPDPQFRVRPDPDFFFQIKIRPEPEPDPDPKYFKFYVVVLKKELI